MELLDGMEGLAGRVVISMLERRSGSEVSASEDDDEVGGLLKGPEVD